MIVLCVCLFQGLIARAILRLEGSVESVSHAVAVVGVVGHHEEVVTLSHFGTCGPFAVLTRELVVRVDIVGQREPFVPQVEVTKAVKLALILISYHVHQASTDFVTVLEAVSAVPGQTGVGGSVHGQRDVVHHFAAIQTLIALFNGLEVIVCTSSEQCGQHDRSH